jgi:hypothetical protein
MDATDKSSRKPVLWALSNRVDRIRGLTIAPRIKPTSIFLRSARQPNRQRLHLSTRNFCSYNRDQFSGSAICALRTAVRLEQQCHPRPESRTAYKIQRQISSGVIYRLKNAFNSTASGTICVVAAHWWVRMELLADDSGFVRRLVTAYSRPLFTLPLAVCLFRLTDRLKLLVELWI